MTTPTQVTEYDILREIVAEAAKHSADLGDKPTANFMRRMTLVKPFMHPFMDTMWTIEKPWRGVYGLWSYGNTSNKLGHPAFNCVMMSRGYELIGVACTKDHAVVLDRAGTFFVLNLDNFVLPCLLFDERGTFSQVDVNNQVLKPSAGYDSFIEAKPGKTAARVYFMEQIPTLNFVRKERYWKDPCVLESPCPA